MNNNINNEFLNNEEQIHQQKITKNKKIEITNNEIVFIMSIIFSLLMIYMLLLYINTIDKKTPCDNLYINKSNIHDIGVYTKDNYNKNDRILLD